MVMGWWVNWLGNWKCDTIYSLYSTGKAIIFLKLRTHLTEIQELYSFGLSDSLEEILPGARKYALYLYWEKRVEINALGWKNWDTSWHPQLIHQQHKSTQLKMLSCSMFRKQCFRQKYDIIVIFQRHFSGLPLEEAEDLKKINPLRSHCLRNQLLQWSSELSCICTAVMGIAMTAENASAHQWAWLAMSFALAVSLNVERWRI